MKIEAKMLTEQFKEALLGPKHENKQSVNSSKEKFKTPISGLLNFDEYVLDEENQPKIPLYNQRILRLLDDLECPLLLLPRIKSGNVIQKVGFFTDIRFTGIATIALIVKIAKSFQAGLTLFNFAEPSIPEMDDDYAQSFFMNKGMSKVNGMELKLVNIEKATEFNNLEAILNRHDIDLVTAMNGRKDLLYKLDFG
jgi:hypothetical protein